MDQEQNQEITNVGAGGGVDADELRRAGQRLLAVLDELSPAAQKPIELMRTLFANTVKYLDAGVSVSDAQFTADELNAAIKGQPEGADSAEVAARYVRSNANNLATLMAEKREDITSRLRALGEYSQVVIRKTESRGRHKSYYFLGLEPIEQRSDREADRHLPASHIKYRVAQTPKPVSWAKPLLRIDLGERSLSKHLYVAAFSLFIVGATLLIIAPILTQRAARSRGYRQQPGGARADCCDFRPVLYGHRSEHCDGPVLAAKARRSVCTDRDQGDRSRSRIRAPRE